MQTEETREEHNEVEYLLSKNDGKENNWLKRHMNNESPIKINKKC